MNFALHGQDLRPSMTVVGVFFVVSRYVYAFLSSSPTCTVHQSHSSGAVLLIVLSIHLADRKGYKCSRFIFSWLMENVTIVVYSSGWRKCWQMLPVSQTDGEGNNCLWVSIIGHWTNISPDYKWISLFPPGIVLCLCNLAVWFYTCAFLMSVSIPLFQNILLRENSLSWRKWII